MAFGQSKWPPASQPGLWPVQTGLWPVPSGLWPVPTALWPVQTGCWSVQTGLQPVQTGIHSTQLFLLPLNLKKLTEMCFSDSGDRFDTPLEYTQTTFNLYVNLVKGHAILR